MRVLGDVTYVMHAKRAFARVRPRFDVSGESPRAIDRLKEFPAEGLAYWSDPPSSVEVNDFVVFTPEPNKDGATPDWFQVGMPELAIEVLDLRTTGEHEAVRLLRTVGLRFHDLPGKVLLWCSDHAVFGPLRLKQLSTGMWTFGELERLAEVDRHDPAGLQIQAVSSSPKRYFTRPSAEPAVGAADWDDDEEVLRRALMHVASCSERGSTTAPAEEDLRAAAKHIAARGSPRERALASYRIERLHRWIHGADNNAALSRTIFEAVSNDPRIKAHLTNVSVATPSKNERHAGADREDEAASATVMRNSLAELEGEHSRRKAKNQLERDREVAALVKLKNETATERATLESLKHEVAAMELHRKRDKEANTDCEPGSVGVAKRDPQGSQAKVTTPRQAAGDSPVLRPQLGVQWERPAKLINDQQVLVRALTDGLRSRGVPQSIARSLYGALLARMIPVVAGLGRMEVLEALADVLAAGRIHRLPIGPSFTTSSDVFGCTDPSGRFYPHTHGLLDLFAEAARHPDKFVVVALEGINRAPSEGVLPSIVRAASGASPAVRLTHTGVAGSSAVVAHDVVWPPNAILTATLCQGSTTLPLCPELTAYCAVTVLDLEDPPEWKPDRGPLAYSEVLASSGLLKPAAAPSVGPIWELRQELDALGLSPLLRARLRAGRAGAQRLLTGLTRVPGLDARQARQILARCCLGPAVALLDSGADEAIRALQPRPPGAGDGPSLAEVANAIAGWIA